MAALQYHRNHWENGCVLLCVALMHLSPLPHSYLSGHSCAVPVCIWSDLSELWLAPHKDHVLVGHVEKEELHVDGRGWLFPWLKHTAAFDQNNFLLIHKIQKKNDETHTQKQQTDNISLVTSLMRQPMFKSKTSAMMRITRWLLPGKLKVNASCHWSRFKLGKRVLSASRS